MTTTATLDDLRTRFSGSILTSDDPGYDEARKVHNGLIDKYPGVIARCLGTADIADAVNHAREHGFEISVKGGGHNVGGRAVTEGGLMIDLSLMKGMYVDPHAKTIRAQGGVTWNEFNRATHAHGLAVTGGVISSTGVAGLTLGGGLGWLMSSYGMAVDNLLSLELVTADGQMLQVSEEENPDLFWACRGGGGNFGVASSFLYRLHPLTTVTAGLIAHPLTAGPKLLRFYRDFTAAVGDDLTVFAALVHAPDGSGAKLSAMVAVHVGSPGQAEKDMAPLKSFGEPILVQVGPMPYPVANTLLDDGFPKGALNYWKAAFLSGLSDEFIDTAVERFATAPSPMSGMVIEHFHGQVTRIEPTATAFPHRERGHNLLIAGEWLDPAATEENITWVKETYGALENHFSGSRYVNYLDADEAPDAVRDAYGVVYARLVDVKRRYDPDNLFHLNQNIDPGG